MRSNFYFFSILFIILFFYLFNTENKEKCIKFIDENNMNINSVRLYLLSLKESLSETTSSKPLFLDDGVGILIGKSKKGIICFKPKEEVLFIKNVYKIVAPVTLYKNHIQYFHRFDSIPTQIILQKK